MLTMTAVQAAGLWSGLLLFVLIVLSVNVVIGRNRHRVLLGDGGVEPMNVAVRAFGNAAEYIPIGIGALILMALLGAPVWLMHVVGGLLFAGRAVHPFGLSTTGRPRPARLIGMVLTYCALVTAAINLVTRSLTG
jgi:uncharacterized membrane protein YecN with MAPEG domain